MSYFTLDELTEATQGERLTSVTASSSDNSDSSGVFRLWTDTRTLQSGDFFVPLAGENFDGHHYLAQAFAQGAGGAFIQKTRFLAHPDWSSFPNLIGVEDPLKAYLAMARWHRRKINPCVIAITGSSGKTTTKELMAAALSPYKKTVKTEKNFNNEVGVSQTLLSLKAGDEVLVVEMGMRGLGEIAILSEAAEPDIALITNVGPAHIGRLGSLENIAKAKLEIVAGLNPEHGILVINGDDPYLQAMAPSCWKGNMKSYHYQDVELMEPFTLPVPGTHMVMNALGVLKVGECLGLFRTDLIQGFSAFVPEHGRWERFALPGYHEVWVIDDAYNANPDSVKASLKTFLDSVKDEKNPSSMIQKPILILGGMKELGDFSQAYHEKLGEWLAGEMGIQMLLAIGEEATWIAQGAKNAGFPVFACKSTDEAIAHLLTHHPSLENVTLYLKGSRAYHLDEIPEKLCRRKAGKGTESRC